MTLIVPDVGEIVALTKILDQSLTLKLFSNDIVPAESDTAASYTEVAGGGYAAKPLVGSGWSYVSGISSYGIYSAQDFNFTGPTNAPGTVYGYFIVDNSNVVIIVERFGAGVLPFSPIAGSLVRITPRLEGS